jgi:hypothetical protein
MTQQQGPPVRVAHGRLGRGVFATRAAAVGATLEVCPTLEVPTSEITGVLLDYVFESGDREDTSILLLGYGMLYNHSAEPNAEYVVHGEQEVAFVAIRPVQEGDEVTISYGEDWWDTRDRVPD